MWVVWLEVCIALSTKISLQSSITWCGGDSYFYANISQDFAVSIFRVSDAPPKRRWHITNQQWHHIHEEYNLQYVDYLNYTFGKPFQICTDIWM
jgi:hypothetical protein